jgi:spore coat protein U-like protein
MRFHRPRNGPGSSPKRRTARPQWSKRKQRAVVGGLLFGGLLFAIVAPERPIASAAAATTFSPFAYTAMIPASCTVAASPMVFRPYSGAVDTATATFTITCTNSTPYDIGLSAGSATGATVTTRHMTGPGHAVLTYALTSDAAHSVNWGQTVGADTMTGIGIGSAQVLTVYGKIGAKQFPAPGDYVDTIRATVTY